MVVVIVALTISGSIYHQVQGASIGRIDIRRRILRWAASFIKLVAISNIHRSISPVHQLCRAKQLLNKNKTFYCVAIQL